MWLFMKFFSFCLPRPTPRSAAEQISANSPGYRWHYGLSLLAISVVSTPLNAASLSNFGGTGLMQMPTARLQPEGQFSAAYQYNDVYDFYTASLALFPWLEATARYALVHDLLYSNDPSFSGDTEYTDKSFDVKLRLLEESYWLPQVSVGFQDFAGTGLFDGEYLVASKRWGAFDVTLGLGWGYMGNRGNFRGDKSRSNDCGRDTSYKDNGGSFDYGRMFTGCSALFGGIEYQTPYQPLSLKIEYDGNDYRSDFPVVRGKTEMTPATPWNFGVNYAFAHWGDLRVSYERGNSLHLGLRLHSNFNQIKSLWLEEAKPAYQPAEPRSTMTNEEWQQLTAQIEQVAGYQSVSIYQDDQSVTVKGEQTRYRDRDEAHERVARVIVNSGISANEIRIVETEQQQPLTETILDRTFTEQVLNQAYIGSHISDAITRQDPQPIQGHRHTQPKSTLDFGVAPVLEQSFGSAEDFYLFAVGVRGDVSYRLNQHWLFSASLYGNVYDNYDKLNYTVPSDGTDLKRVRTLSRAYLDDRFRVHTAQINYIDYQGYGIYNQFYGGYLESMFAGVGTEWLYRPLDSQWAVGVDINYVAQRDPRRALGIYHNEHQSDGGLDYRVQTGTVTGHASLYWQPSFWSVLDNTLFQISAGRYLSEDVGVTLDFSKQFASGIIVGAFAAKTDLSAEDFGEGSFNKGFYVSIPLETMTAKRNTSRATLGWMPIQRDGGQMLNRQYGLYGMTDARSPWYGRPAR